MWSAEYVGPVASASSGAAILSGAIAGPLRVWACAAGDGRIGPPPPCTRQTALGSSGRLTLPAAITGQVRVVVVGRR